MTPWMNMWMGGSNRLLNTPILHKRKMRFKGTVPWPQSHELGSGGAGIWNHVEPTPRIFSLLPASSSSPSFPILLWWELWAKGEVQVGVAGLFAVGCPSTALLFTRAMTQNPPVCMVTCQALRDWKCTAKNVTSDRLPASPRGRHEQGWL